MESSVLRQRLERKAYKSMKQAYKAIRAKRELHLPMNRPGRPLKVEKGLRKAQADQQETINRYDCFVWLCGEIRQVLEPYTSQYTLTSVQQAKETFETAIFLLQELGDTDVSKYASRLLKHEDELLAPIVWLEEQLAPYRQSIDPGTEAAIIWSYKHRDELGLEKPGEAFPSELCPVVEAFWQALDAFHRSSSLAESLHSWLRPYLQAHRGMPEWLMPLLQIYWNHHTFQRGKRKGNTPLGLAGVDDTASWSQMLDRMFGSPDVESQVA